jgi:plasmid replication initiation protein
MSHDEIGQQSWLTQNVVYTYREDAEKALKMFEAIDPYPNHSIVELELMDWFSEKYALREELANAHPSNVWYIDRIEERLKLGR